MSKTFQIPLPNGTELVLRYPQLADVPAMHKYINVLSAEQTFVRFQGEEISLEEETAFVTGLLNAISNHRALTLLAWIGDSLVGISSIELKQLSEKHEGVFGISVAKEYRGQGVGKVLMQHVLAEAEASIPELRIITLGVFETNHLAQKMYRQFGFVEYGRLPKGVKYRGEYIDQLFMYKTVRE